MLWSLKKKLRVCFRWRASC